MTAPEMFDYLANAAISSAVEKFCLLVLIDMAIIALQVAELALAMLPWLLVGWAFLLTFRAFVARLKP